MYDNCDCDCDCDCDCNAHCTDACVQNRSARVDVAADLYGTQRVRNASRALIVIESTRSVAKRREKMVKVTDVCACSISNESL